MKRTEIGLPRRLVFIYRVLILIAAGLVLAILGGTIYGLNRRGPAVRPAVEERAETGTRREGGRTRYFTGIGRIRAATAGSPDATVIISIAFPYDGSDKAFSEELASHLRDFREIAADLISSNSADQLRAMGEDALKQQLLDRYNSLLRLGKIGTLYFNDYLILE